MNYQPMTTIVLPLPETTNQTYRSVKGHWYKSAKQKAWEEAAGWEIRKLHTITGTTALVSVVITWYLKRERDIDGGIKPILDILAKYGFYANDKQVRKLTVYKLFDKDNPRCEVRITL